MTYVAPTDGANEPHVAGYLLPIGLRNFVRSRETGVVAVAIGLISGVLVAAISQLSGVAHALLFDIPFDAHLSAMPTRRPLSNSSRAGPKPTPRVITPRRLARGRSHRRRHGCEPD